MTRLPRRRFVCISRGMGVNGRNEAETRKLECKSCSLRTLNARRRGAQTVPSRGLALRRVGVRDALRRLRQQL